MSEANERALDAIAALFVRAVEQGIERDLAQEALVRDEIKQRGTYWAAGEIYSLRRQVAALKGRVSE